MSKNKENFLTNIQTNLLSYRIRSV